MNNILAYESVIAGRGETLAAAIARLSDESGMTINHSVWYRWRAGQRTPPPHVLRIINREIAGHVIKSRHKLRAGPGTLADIAAAFSPPERRNP